ncbi:hypothetical protein V6N13_129124 [Hibiscus sabdariffa]
MISSLEASSLGGSITTSQCSKSQPSGKIASFGGLFESLGLGSLREDMAAGVENDLTDGESESRRRRRKEGEVSGDGVITVLVEEAAAADEEKEEKWREEGKRKEDRDLGFERRERDRGRVCVAIFGS